MTPEEALATRLREMVRAEIGLDPFLDPIARDRIFKAATAAAADIARHGRTAVTLPALLVTGKGPYHLAVTLFRHDLAREGDA